MLEEIGTRFRVTVSTERISAPSLDEKDRVILDALKGDDGCLTSEVAEAIGLSTRATRTRLVRLIERGLVQEIGTSLRIRSDGISELIRGIVITTPL